MATEYQSTFASGTPPKSLDTGSAAGSEARSRTAELGKKFTDTADQARSSAAAGLSNAADAIDDAATEGADRAKGVAHRAAKALSGGADYIRDNSAQEMMDDAMTLVKANPGVALLGAAAVGFVVGRAFASRS